MDTKEAGGTRFYQVSLASSNNQDQSGSVLGAMTMSCSGRQLLFTSSSPIFPNYGGRALLYLVDSDAGRRMIVNFNDAGNRFCPFLASVPPEIIQGCDAFSSQYAAYNVRFPSASISADGMMIAYEVNYDRSGGGGTGFTSEIFIHRRK